MICVVSEMINEGFDTGNVIVVLKCFDLRAFSFHSEGVLFDAYTGSCLPYMATNWFKEIVQPKTPKIVKLQKICKSASSIIENVQKNVPNWCLTEYSGQSDESI